MGLGDGHLADHAVRRGIDDHCAVRAPAQDEHPPTVARDGESVRIGAHFDARNHAVRAGVDDAHRGAAVTAHVDLAPVWCHDQPMRSLGHRDGLEDLVLSDVDDGHRIVLEKPHVGFGRTGCPSRTHSGRPADEDQNPEHRRSALQHGVTSERLRNHHQC